LNRYPQTSTKLQSWLQVWKRRINERFSEQYDIYLYHRVHPSAANNNPLGLKVTPEQFDQQLNWLKKNREVLPLRELVDQHNNPSSNCTAITFDDGYVDNYEHAFPIIKKHKLPVTIFLTTFWVDNYRRMLCDQLDLCVKHGSIDKNKFNQTAWRIRHLMPDERQCLLEHQFNYDPLWELRKLDDKHAMSWKMIREMQKSGLVQFEVHGHQHLSCRYLSKDQFEHEILRCKELISENIGIEPELFAYPYGSYEDVHPDCAKWVEDLGFKAAFLAYGANNHKHHSKFFLDRTQNIPSP
jgi:peptidoglycan/xylan/chitin deacetylase (PgdA/CDA1 family)